jgi:hypothetical protein
MDATIAVSEPGVNVVLQKALALAHASSSDTKTWGPFQVGYSASVALSGGVAVLENAPANKLDLNNVNVAGSVSAFFTFDLGLILPTICIPPFQVCVDIPFIGTVCTPQFCIPWPSVHVAVNLPFAFGLSASFGLRVDDLGTKWGIVLLIDPFSARFDLTPMGPLIIAAIQNEVSNTLGAIPLIGGLIAGLVNTVIGAFSGVLTPILGAFSSLINLVLSLLDLLNVNIPYTLLTFDKTQTFVPANTPLLGDAPVNMTLALLQAEVLDRELLAEGQLA